MVGSSSFIGGALSFKGDKKVKKKKSKSKHSTGSSKVGDDEHAHASSPPPPDTVDGGGSNKDDDNPDLTEAEKRALLKKRARERQELEVVARKSHRQRIEEFNQALASVTEHNDIPRVSAAGNG